MSIDTYANLQTAVANWQGRSDLTSRITEGIALAEAKINRKLRTKDMETKNATFSITGEYVAVPTGFGGVKTFYHNSSPRARLELMGDDEMTTRYSTTAKPKYFNVQGSNFRFAPVPDATYSATLVYFLQVPALSVSNTTNWLLTSHPDAYLYLTNAEMAAFAKDWASAKAWEDQGYAILAEIVSISNSDKRSSGPIATRPDSPTY